MLSARLFHALGRLPLAWLHRLGAVAGRVAWLASPTYRRHLNDHLSQALGPAQARALRGAAIAHAGRGLLELAYVWQRPLPEVLARVQRVEGLELVEAARTTHRGVVFMTPHLGCFDIVSLLLGQSLPITILYRAPKLAWLGAFLEAGRGRGNVTLAPADLKGVRRLMAALKKGEAAGLLPDQVPGKGEGVWLPFFGRPAYTMTLAARLTQVGDPLVVLAFGERLPNGQGYVVHFMPPPVPVEGDTLQRAAAINACVEALIRRYPEQYLWGYNRYKVPAGAEPPPRYEESGQSAGDSTC